MIVTTVPSPRPFHYGFIVSDHEAREPKGMKQRKMNGLMHHVLNDSFGFDFNWKTLVDPHARAHVRLEEYKKNGPCAGL